MYQKTKQVQEELLRAKEEVVKLELNYTKEIQDLDNKFTSLKSEKDGIEVIFSKNKTFFRQN